MGAIMTDAHRRMHFFFDIFGRFFAVSGHSCAGRSPEALVSGVLPGLPSAWHRYLAPIGLGGVSLLHEDDDGSPWIVTPGRLEAGDVRDALREESDTSSLEL
jgi:hypothetical protein